MNKTYITINCNCIYNGICRYKAAIEYARNIWRIITNRNDKYLNIDEYCKLNVTPPKILSNNNTECEYHD